jgi:hypothetical protein
MYHSINKFYECKNILVYDNLYSAVLQSAGSFPTILRNPLFHLKVAKETEQCSGNNTT